ncbi:hypothetical protein QZH46_17360 [Pseudomonas corrugata]
MGGILIVLAGKRRPAGGSNGGGSAAWTGCRDSARQSCADEAQAAVLAKLNEGVRGFHALNPNRVGEDRKQSEKIEISSALSKVFEILLRYFVGIVGLLR